MIKTPSEIEIVPRIMSLAYIHLFLSFPYYFLSSIFPSSPCLSFSFLRLCRWSRSLLKVFSIINVGSTKLVSTILNKKLHKDTITLFKVKNNVILILKMQVARYYPFLDNFSDEFEPLSRTMYFKAIKI